VLEASKDFKVTVEEIRLVKISTAGSEKGRGE